MLRASPLFLRPSCKTGDKFNVSGNKDWRAEMFLNLNLVTSINAAKLLLIGGRNNKKSLKTFFCVWLSTSKRAKLPELEAQETIKIFHFLALRLRPALRHLPLLPSRQSKVKNQ
jgi:hypothetical protein